MADMDGGQLSLDFGAWSGLSRPHWRNAQENKLYFSVLPNAEAAARMRSFAEQFLEAYHVDEAMRPPHLLHFSLNAFNLAVYPLTKVLPLAERAAAAIAIPAFSISCDHVMGFGKWAKPALALTCGSGKTAIETLYSKFDYQIRSLGFSPARSAFTPHVTIAYAQRPFAENPNRAHQLDSGQVRSRLQLTRPGPTRTSEALAFGGLTSMAPARRLAHPKHTHINHRRSHGMRDQR